MIPPTAEVLLTSSGLVERTHYIIYAWNNGKMHVATAAVPRSLSAGSVLGQRGNRSSAILSTKKNPNTVLKGNITKCSFSDTNITVTQLVPHLLCL